MSEFVEPEEVRPMEDSLFCFLDANRPCASDCLAYLVDSPVGADYINQKWSRCVLLLNTHRATKVLDRGLQVYSNRVADAQRAGSAPYVNVDPVTGRQL